MILGSSGPPEKAKTGLSVIVSSLSRADEPTKLIQAYLAALAPLGYPVELIYVVELGSPLVAGLEALALPNLKVLELPDRFGEAAKVREAVREAESDAILLLPPYQQVDPASLPDIVRALDASDVVVAERDRRDEALWNRARGLAFQQIARVSGSKFNDLGCRVRACRREVLETISLQENQIGFLAILAEHAGFRVDKVVVPQASEDRSYRSHAPGTYVDSLLDSMSVAFLVRFLQKPFRLFGGVGLVLTLLGLLVALILVIQRSWGIGIGDRPALLLSVLLVVLGIQLAAVGLIAEIVLFTRLPATSTYRIRRIHRRTPVAGDIATSPVAVDSAPSPVAGDTELASPSRADENSPA